MADEKLPPKKSKCIKGFEGIVPLRRKEPASLEEMQEAIMAGAVARFERSKRT